MSFGIADDIIQEPLGGSNDWMMTKIESGNRIIDELTDYESWAPEKVKDERYNKFRSLTLYTTLGTCLANDISLGIDNEKGEFWVL